MRGILDSWKNMTSQDKGQTQATISVSRGQLHAYLLHAYLGDIAAAVDVAYLTLSYAD